MHSTEITIQDLSALQVIVRLINNGQRDLAQDLANQLTSSLAQETAKALLGGTAKPSKPAAELANDLRASSKMTAA